AGTRRREIVGRLAAAHHPRLRLHLVVLEPAPPEDLVVRALMRTEARLESFLVAVERIRVLHDELADADETRARPRLVAVLRLEVVPGLRQLPVALELACMKRERLLMREREDVVGVLDVKDLGNPDSPRRLPELG